MNFGAVIKVKTLNNSLSKIWPHILIFIFGIILLLVLFFKEDIFHTDQFSVNTLVYQINQSNDNEVQEITLIDLEPVTFAVAHDKTFWVAGQKKLIHLLSEPEQLRWQVDIGVYNCNLLDTEEVTTALAEYRKNLDKKIEECNNLLTFLHESNCPPHRIAIATRPVFLLQAQRAWIDSFESHFNSIVKQKSTIHHHAHQ